MALTHEEQLNTYQFEGKKLVVGFGRFEEAQAYADAHAGKLVEVGFLDGNDNPTLTNEAGLIDKKLHYFVEAGPEYKFIHSSDPGFRDYADELQKIKSKIREDSPEEKYFSNAEIEIAEDPIIVLKNDQFESVTSRERSKYLKQANVYEIGVELIS